MGGDGWGQTSEAFSRYLLTRGRARDTATTYAEHLHIFYLWCCGEPAVASEETCERFLADQLATRARGTAHVRLCAVKAYFKWLVEIGVRKENPAVKLTVRKERHMARPPVNDGDELRLINACHDDEERLLFILGFRLGLRVAEIVSLRIEDIYPERGCLFIKGKGSKERILPMPPAVFKSIVLVAGERGRGPVFQKWTREQARRIMKRVARNAGVVGFYPHKMRISFAVHFLDKLHDVDSLQTLMGHASADVTIKYASFNRTERALQQLRSLQAAEHYLT